MNKFKIQDLTLFSLYGDSEFASFSRYWTRTLVNQDGAIIRTYENLLRDFSGIDDTVGGDDRLFGGKGNDTYQFGIINVLNVFSLQIAA